MSDLLEFEKQYRTVVVDKEDADFLLAKKPDGTYKHKLVDNAHKLFILIQSK
jgi:hypothetical protein